MRNFALGAVLWILCGLVGRGFMEPKNCSEVARGLHSDYYVERLRGEHRMYLLIGPLALIFAGVGTGFGADGYGFGYGCLDKMAKEAK
jgi:hypothetical protein